MITFEVNIICDACREQYVSGEPSSDIQDAIESAKKQAERHYWKLLNGKWKCSECLDDEQKHQNNHIHPTIATCLPKIP